ncbi:DUF2071 domain-containing protein [soil metagenome]
MTDNKKIFLSAEWQNLIMINYEVDPKVLLPFLPAFTQLDQFENKTLVSLVGFLFKDTKVFGIRWPGHTTFEEVNLRFYVKHFTGKEWRRGVVFISEIVPKSIIANAASLLYHEPYIKRKMRHQFLHKGDLFEVQYQWKNKKKWNSINVTAETTLYDIERNSAQEFIFEHYWGYNKYSDTKTVEYGVEHITWQTHKIKNWSLYCDIENVYGADFLPFLNKKPDSVFMAKGSSVIIRKPKYIIGR